jgi:hypothetical protein
MSDAIDIQEVTPSRAEKVLRRKKMASEPLTLAGELIDADPTTQAGLVAVAYSGTKEGIIETGDLTMKSLSAFKGDADRLDSFLTGLLSERFLSEHEARLRLASPKLVKFRKIGENKDLLRNEQIFRFLTPSYSTMYQVILLWEQLSEGDSHQKLMRLTGIFESAPGEITREFLSDETERARRAAKPSEPKHTKIVGGAGRAAAPRMGRAEELLVDLALFTPSDRDLTALATPYAAADELEHRMSALAAVRERDNIGIIAVVPLSALPVIADKLLPLCGFDFGNSRIFLAHQPDSPEVTRADAIIVARRGEIDFDQLESRRWLNSDTFEPADFAARLFPDAKERLHVFARTLTPGWKSVVGSDNWLED